MSMMNNQEIEEWYDAQSEIASMDFMPDEESIDFMHDDESMIWSDEDMPMHFGELDEDEMSWSPIPWQEDSSDEDEFYPPDAFDVNGDLAGLWEPLPTLPPDEVLLREVTERDREPDEPAFLLDQEHAVNLFSLYLFRSRSFKNKDVCNERTYRVRMLDPENGYIMQSLHEALFSLFERILRDIRRSYNPGSRVRIFVTHPQLQRPVIIAPTYLGHLSSWYIMQVIEDVLSSAENIPADENLEINVGVCSRILGKGRTKLIVGSDVSNMKSVVEIKNCDNICLPRAIVVGKARIAWEKETDSAFKLEKKKFYDRIRKSENSLQAKEAKELLEQIQFDMDKIGDLADVPIYEDAIGCNIIVISIVDIEKPIYRGCHKYEDNIFLFHRTKDGEGHFDTITNVKGFCGKKHYCYTCFKGFNDPSGHVCANYCNVCCRDNCPVQNEKICVDCNMTCRSHDCFKAHKENRKGKGKYSKTTLDSPCQQKYKCLSCRLVMYSSQKQDHICGESFCRNCQKTFNDVHHQCFLRSASSEGDVNKIIFYDFECVQDDGNHVPNLVVVQTVCKFCEDVIELNSTSKCDYCGSRCIVCEKWDNVEKTYVRNPCSTCGQRQLIFSGHNTLKDFGNWLINKRNGSSTVIAHNAKSYDNYFIYEYLVNNHLAPNQVIFTGTKIMYMSLTKQIKLRFLDSVNFLPMPLSKLPKSFGLTELKKGYFPHLFNTAENQHVTLNHLPDVKYYCPNQMNLSERGKFLQWYEEHKNDTFIFREEITQYCISDVDILRRACCEFRNLFRNVTGKKEKVPLTDEGVERMEWHGALDPLSFTTIASVCMGLFKFKFLPEKWRVLMKQNAKQNCNHGSKCECIWSQGRKLSFDSPYELLTKNQVWVGAQGHTYVKAKFESSPLALLPNVNVLGKDVYSIVSLEWLALKERELNISIQSAISTEGEKRVTISTVDATIKHKLDGYAVVLGQPTAFEFYGCSFHGCPRCFRVNRMGTKIQGKNLDQRYNDTQAREARLKKFGFKVVSIWSCQFEEMKRSNPKLLEGIETINPPLSLKEAYFGGRTNALVLHKKMRDGEKGYYLDFTSLYPAVLKYKKYPTGHPERIVKNFRKMRSLSHCKMECRCARQHIQFPYFGIAKVTLLPPQDLHIPVLPVRINGKLKFPLCYRCAKEESKAACDCTDEKRMLTGTFCTPEIEVALNKGYKLISIHEVLHWKTSETYNEESKEGGLFTRYINTFLKLKQQASGLPDGVTSDVQIDEYLADYFEHEGIQLDKNQIEKNPGLRSLSKLALNSFYGKFGQNMNKSRTAFITEIEEFYQYMTDQSKIIKDWHILSHDMMMLEYSTKDNFDIETFAGNVVIAAMCTCWARLKLWGEMFLIGERVLYHDTDSIIFTAEEGDYIPATGSYLGQFTDEINCKELGCPPECSESHWIKEFVSCGPKNYAYKLNTGQAVCKVRGFSLNYENAQILNFESMKTALLSWHRNEPQTFKTVNTRFLRDKTNPRIFNKLETKKYGVVYDKRQVLDDLSTRPYGFKAKKHNL